MTTVLTADDRIFVAARHNGWSSAQPTSCMTTEYTKPGQPKIVVTVRNNGAVNDAYTLAPGEEFPRNIVGKDKAGQIIALLSA